jgi:hypothetical protein
VPELNDAVARWFEARRGIKRATVDAFGITTDKKNIIIPYPEGMTKYRWSSDSDNPFGLEKEGRGFSWKDAAGNSGAAGQVPFLPPDFAPRERMIIVEGETDTMAAWQALPDKLRDKVSIVGLSGVGSWRKAVTERGKLDELFGLAKHVFVVLDNDDPYENPDGAKSVERGWRDIRSDLGRRARRVKLPQGPADVAEFFQTYDWAAFEVLLKAAAAPVRHFKPIDWTQPTPETDWLVKDLLVMGEVTVLAGDSGIGKSFLTQALGHAVASGETLFLGRKLLHNGLVMYVDEENSESLIVQRIKALGLKPEHYENFEYISYGGVNLFAAPGLLLEQAIDTDPTLIVLDSQSAVALGAEENSNDDMTKLYKRAIKPLARETGAAVIVLHHVPKDGQVPRGAGAIKAQADLALTALKTETSGIIFDRFNIFASKGRRQVKGIKVQITGSVEEDGWVRVENPEDDEAM